MNRKSLLLATALSLVVAAPVLAQGGGGGGGGGAGGGAGGAAGSAASSGAGTGTSSSANGGPSAPSGMGTNATTTGVHTNNSPTNPNVQPPTPNGTAPATGSSQTTQSGTDRSGITATNGSNGVNGQQMSPAEQARTGVKTLPQDQAPGAVSAPGVGVGHAANGLPIGTPGSGTSNVDQK
ncbi:hypothetical protein XH80_04360 [Bradyrhizobium sp. CCBAU 45384]|nr:hypothetical protein [Bradyrhizobium sp. CCBAU 45384]